MSAQLDIYAQNPSLGRGFAYCVVSLYEPGLTDLLEPRLRLGVQRAALRPADDG